MTQVDAVVVGAGVIGLAVGRALARAGLETLILDSEPHFGSATSARNSEVIHAGLYYRTTPLKAALCTRGRQLLYAYCRDRGVPHSRLGKLIFAAEPAQSTVLDEIAGAGAAAGVDDLVRLGASEAKRIEPQLRCHEAILSPSTGIIDSHAYMQALLGDAEDHGARFVARTRVTALSRTPAGWGVHIEGEAAPAVVAGRVVNAAGLEAHKLAAATDGMAGHVPIVRYARGVYFDYGRVPFDRLIYPVPVPGGLGTHLTLDLAGRARFGPDVEWIDTVDYTVDPARGAAFLAAARRIWPEIDPARLVPGYAGIRPKLSGPGEPAADFAIIGPEQHGQDGLVALFGIESPGLTASLAIAEHVTTQLDVTIARND
ncbi:L-2-hydroxyglutarate oxidase LhgO [Sphingomonas laterariae]|uniref:L-2-hydroxyglutarate oxidase LhgO n=1 Tax=Edaphosphingomonas laterariae TaxID=861865 RepID=A0A239IJU9_9SPHN|nr:NAD(P)/FAD-dependent oxidoreductase [Sphingomonas laterariae]SNS93819.1 L-2-hydroxyglutarate oxidase LhgO [Sphingomonas laterariae]